MPAPLPLPTRRATLTLGQRLGQNVARGDLLLLEGPLGAGKTFLARSICRSLGVGREETVASPSFALVHEYQVRLPAEGGAPATLLHADLYRLEAPPEVRLLGLREARACGAVVVAEWAERFRDELGPDGLVVRLSDGKGRSAELYPLGPRGETIALGAAPAGGA